MAFDSIDPATGERLNSYEETSADEVQAILEKCAATQRAWARTAFAERSRLMRSAAQVLRDHKDEYARLMVREMGKIYTQGVAEVEKCAWACDYYAEQAEGFLAPEEVATEAAHSFVTYKPLGVVLAVMPWNFPLWQVFRFAVPALMAGNSAVLKHASNVFGCALLIEKIFLQAGFPENLFRSLLIGPAQASEVIHNPLVAAVTLTGSVKAGRAVASEAGKVLKKCVLELGGSDPFIVLEDADIDKAVQVGVVGRFQNSGQSCIAAKRFIIVDAVYASVRKQVRRGGKGAENGRSHGRGRLCRAPGARRSA